MDKKDYVHKAVLSSFIVYISSSDGGYSHGRHTAFKANVQWYNWTDIWRLYKRQRCHANILLYAMVGWFVLYREWGRVMRVSGVGVFIKECFFGLNNFKVE